MPHWCTPARRDWLREASIRSDDRSRSGLRAGELNQRAVRSSAACRSWRLGLLGAIDLTAREPGVIGREAIRAMLGLLEATAQDGRSRDKIIESCDVDPTSTQNSTVASGNPFGVPARGSGLRRRHSRDPVGDGAY